jgi:hypothetical protein
MGTEEEEGRAGLLHTPPPFLPFRPQHLKPPPPPPSPTKQGKGRKRRAPEGEAYFLAAAFFLGALFFLGAAFFLGAVFLAALGLVACGGCEGRKGRGNEE